MHIYGYQQRIMQNSPPPTPNKKILHKTLFSDYLLAMHDKVFIAFNRERLTTYIQKSWVVQYVNKRQQYVQFLPAKEYSGCMYHDPQDSPVPKWLP